MNGYSKMKTISDTKSRSLDFSSDGLSPPSSSPEIRNPKLETPETNLEQKQIKNNPIFTTTAAAVANNSTNKTQDSFSEQEEEGEEEEEEDHLGSNINCNTNNNIGEKFGGHVKLSRNSTVSASSAASHALQSAVNRAFSMRRSSSVTERYRRIHNDQSVTPASPIEDEDLAVKKKKKKKSSKSKILKACKKLFGL